MKRLLLTCLLSLLGACSASVSPEVHPSAKADTEGASCDLWATAALDCDASLGLVCVPSLVDPDGYPLPDATSSCVAAPAPCLDQSTCADDEVCAPVDPTCEICDSYCLKAQPAAAADPQPDASPEPTPEPASN